MSLLADKDFLLQSLQLSYIRHVLPSHSSQTSLQGIGPHNLINFDLSSPIFQSPYVVLGGLTDEQKWPELKSGRNSPPLGIGRGSREDNNGTTTTVRRRGQQQQIQNQAVASGSGLNYSQTIVGKGSGKSGAGMRVGGRERTWKGKGVDSASSTLIEESGEAIVSTGRSRKKSLETALHIRRIGLDGSIPRPPPVIIHSPVQTISAESSNEDGGEVRSYRPDSLPTSPFSLSEDQYARRSSNPYSDDELLSGDIDDQSSIGLPSRGERGNENDSRGFDDGELSHHSFEDDSSANESVLGGEDVEDDEDYITPLPLSNISEGRVLATPRLGSLTSPPTFIRNNESGDIDDLGSLGSSGTSLFGVSRLTGVSEGAIISRGRSDSGNSSLQLTKSIVLPEVIEEAVVPERTFGELVLPKGLRVRERRRVNISSKMLVPITEPSNGEEHPTVIPPVALLVAGTVGEAGNRPRAITDPTIVTATVAPLELAAVGTSLLPTPNTPLKPKLPLLRTTSLPKPTLSLPLTPSRQNTSLTFPRSQNSPLTKSTGPKRSALTALLSSQSSSPENSNPFSSLYAALSSKASDALKLSLYFPHSKTPRKELKVGVKKDLTVEEVIGAGLWHYFEEGREPALEVDIDEGIELETTKWNLRIVEDDGEVDEDFPALDRSRAISAFSFGEFAIVKATDQQIKDNKAKQAKIQRRPSRVLAPPKRTLATNNNDSQSPQKADLNSLKAAGASAFAIPIQLKVKLPPMPGVEGMGTTIEVPSDMYLSDVLDYICRKRDLSNPKDWSLTVQMDGKDCILPLDRTIESLAGNHDLTLVRGEQSRAGVRQYSILNNDPSASIFRQPTEVVASKPTANALTSSNYQRYSVQRKLPMPLGRHPRTIAIDGDYIHLESDANGTVSFHISNIIQCKISKRNPISFKLIVKRDRAEKRYDFETDSPAIAREIVENIKKVRDGIIYTARRRN